MPEEDKTLLQSILNAYHAGLQVVAVQLQDVQPPKQVGDAFKDVASAREDRVQIKRADLPRRTRRLSTDGCVPNGNDFFTLVRTLEAYRKLLKGKITLMLPPQMEFLKYLQE
jgi:hypothetical protein